MKIIYILAVSLLLGAGAMDQQNLNLEEWNGTDPVGFQTLNIGTQIGIPQSTYQEDQDPAEGLYSARVETVFYEDCQICPQVGLPDTDTLSGLMLQEFAVNNGDIPLTFNFSVKYELGAPGDEAILGLQAWNWNASTNEREYIGQAIYTTASEVANWSAQSLDLQWADMATSPDSMQLLIASSASDVGLPGSTAIPGSKLWVDNFEITYEEGSNSLEAINEVAVKAYPNPATDVLIFELNENMASVNIITMDGKTVKTISVSSDVASVNVSNLESGLYYYVVVTESGQTIRNSFIKK